MSNESENEDEIVPYRVEWEDVRRDMKYPANDDNGGFIYGIEWRYGEVVTDVVWYRTDDERLDALFQEWGTIKEVIKKYTEEELKEFGWLP